MLLVCGALGNYGILFFVSERLKKQKAGEKMPFIQTENITRSHPFEELAAAVEH
jgi:hypothetical protein